MPASRRFRDAFAAWLPPWLSDRTKTGPGRNIAFRFLWVPIAALDVLADIAFQALTATLPGVGTPTALRLIGRSRGMVRGRLDTDTTYVQRLRTWLDRWPEAGSQRGLVRVVWDYLGGGCTVRAFNRGGTWTAIDPAGTITSGTAAAWDWDSISNPERAGWWSETWIAVVVSPYAFRAGTWGDGETWGADGFGHGLMIPTAEGDALRALLGQWKSAHSKLRALIFTSDAAKFNPASPASMPNGRWGDWHLGAGASDRDTLTCRYLEFP